MKTQIIQDHNGIPTGVFIPIKEWEKLKEQYPEIDKNNTFELSDEQKQILESQNNLSASEYQDNEQFVAELKKEYGL
jgi:hypothetical protein